MSTNFTTGDGVPFAPIPARPDIPGPVPVDVDHTESIEGPRGRSVRATFIFRYVTYFAIVLVAAAVTQWAFSGGTGGAVAGTFMMASAALILATGAISTWFYPPSRREIILSARHYAFGICVLPGTAIALLYRASLGWLRDPNAGDSFITQLAANALPLSFFATVVIPAVVFIGQMAGRRYLERSRADDQEAVALWTRQDGLQR